MNIKSISPQINIESVADIDRKKEVRSQESSDRDADGRRQGEQQQEEKRHLTEEEIKKVLKAIRNHTGVKSSQLQVNVEYNGDMVYFLLTDRHGNRVRRLNSTEGWHFTKDQEVQKGQLIDKVS